MNSTRGTTLTALAALFCGFFVLPAFANSDVRIVRVSEVEGSVELDRGTGEGFQKAFLNMPIVQGVRLRTNSDARAEVEFEDGSTIRLTPKTILLFTDLSLRDSGGKVTGVDVQQGQVYFTLLKGGKDDEFTVTFDEEKATALRPAHFRIALEDISAELSVFRGDVHVDGPSGEVEVASKHTVTFDFLQDHYELAKNIPQDPYDTWDKQQNDYREHYAAVNSFASPYNYGAADLAYYGSFMNLAGGSCWQPYFTGFGWDPFMDGAWMYYPGYGYSWVSAYPWGWLPYHSGSWMYANNGWCWTPAPTLVMWNVVPLAINPPLHFRPPHPPIIPVPHGIAVVGRGPTATTLQPGARRVVITADDAGIGVPRGRLNLAQLNRELAVRGQATLAVPRAISRGLMSVSGGGGGIGRTTGGIHSSGLVSAGSSHLTSSAASSHSSSGTGHHR